MGKYIQFLLRIEPEVFKKIEMISPNGKISEQMRIMLNEWINIKYPDEDLINKKIEELNCEIFELQQFKNNIKFINIKEQEMLKTTSQYRDQATDSVMNMLYIKFIRNTGDDEFYKKWMNTLKFSSTSELLEYLSEKWAEHGINGVLKYIHRSEFIKNKLNNLELKATLENLELNDFMKKHNIDLYDEYDAGKLKGSIKDFDVFKTSKQK